jgi:protease I
MKLSGRSVLILAGPQYEDLELWYPKIRLEEEGAQTLVAGLGEPVYIGKKGYPVTVDRSVDDLDAEAYDGLVIPGGYAPDHMRRSEKLLSITRAIATAGKPVAFICHAAWVPISAGLLKGRKATCVRAIKDDVVNAGAIYLDEPVVVDGNLISSRTPADLPAFCRAIIQALTTSASD